MWKNTVEPDGPPTTIYRVRIVCWIPKATNTHTGYVILIVFPLQQWLHDAPQCYVVRTWPVFLICMTHIHSYLFVVPLSVLLVFDMIYDMI